MTDHANLTFNDLKPGNFFKLDSYRLTHEEAVAFASRYDPQPYHLDEAGASTNPLFERKSASGWHTVMLMNILASRFFEHTAIQGLGGAGVQELRWIEPVYPGDTLTGSLEIVAVRPSRSKPERGVVTMRVDVENQEHRRVATMTITGIFRR
jgi:acyl dehydratase